MMPSGWRVKQRKALFLRKSCEYFNVCREHGRCQNLKSSLSDYQTLVSIIDSTFGDRLNRSFKFLASFTQATLNEDKNQQGRQEIV